MANSDQELELRSLKARLAVTENMMAYIMRRLGAEERHIMDWYGQKKLKTGDHTYLHGAVNAILGSLKPPPR